MRSVKGVDHGPYVVQVLGVFRVALDSLYASCISEDYLEKELQDDVNAFELILTDGEVKVLFYLFIYLFYLKKKHK